MKKVEVLSPREVLREFRDWHNEKYPGAKHDLPEWLAIQIDLLKLPSGPSERPKEVEVPSGPDPTSDEVVEAGTRVVDCWGVGRLNITAMSQFVDELRAAIEAYHKTIAGEPRPEGTPPLAALHDREAMEAARAIVETVEATLAAKQTKDDLKIYDAVVHSAAAINAYAYTVARALLQGHDREDDATD